jgi:exosortase A
MTIDMVTAARSAADPRGAAWRTYGTAWAAVVAAILLLLARDVAHLVRVWWNSATFGHCLLVVPVVAWLIWQRREGLMRLAPKPWLPGVALMFAGGLLWLLGELAGAAVVRHAAIVGLVIASVPTVLGLAVARGVTFPLFFLLFAIPIGEQLVPYLQIITAHFCIWMLDLFGIPAFLDGVFISIPKGDFEVAEACSGVRFLIAMVAFGTLVSHVCFRSWTRRAIFMTAAILLPILANGIRAWGTIYIAHLTTLDFARGVDHVVYGWFFFAFVMALLLAVGWRFFDRPIDDPMIDPAKLQAPGAVPAPASALKLTAALAVAAVAVSPAYALAVVNRPADEQVASLRLDPPSRWLRTAYQGTPWQPNYKGAQSAMATFVGDDGVPVDVYVAVFDRQEDGAELVGFGQGIYPPQGSGIWSFAGTQAPPQGGMAVQINGGGAVRDVFQYFLVNGRVVGSPYAAKTEATKAKLLGGPTRAATVVISAQRPDPLVSARPSVERLAAAFGPVDAFVDRVTIERTE